MNCPLQHTADRLVQSPQLGRTKRAQLPPGKQPGLKEDLIGVDIPDPRDDLLAQQEPLDGAAPAPKQ